MKVLITGGAGFLGVPLARRLVEEGHAVQVIDDLSAGDRDALDPRVVFTRGDVRDVPRLWGLLSSAEVVFHLAARVSVSESILYPAEYNAVNTAGTVSVMVAARDAGVRRVVLVSSGTVYGEGQTQPIGEDAMPRPQNPYAVSKLAAEGYVRAIGELYRIETVILRVFNAYGPGQAVPPSHPPVIPLFARQILTGGSLVLHGAQGAEPTRDFVYVDDVVEAMLQAAITPGVTGTTVNIGSGQETSLSDLVGVLEAVTNQTARVLRSPEHRGGVSRMRADIARAREVLGWRPQTELATGLTRITAMAAGRH